MDLKQKIEIRIEVWEEIIQENLQKIHNSKDDFLIKKVEELNFNLRVKVQTLKDVLE